MDWNALTTFKVHETGSPQYRDVSLANNLKTKRNLDAQIQAVFAEKNPVAAIIREDRSRVDSDLSVVFLAQGAVLEVSFANKVRPSTIFHLQFIFLALCPRSVRPIFF